MQLPPTACDDVSNYYASKLADGYIVFHESDDTEVARGDMNSPAFSSAVSGLSALNINPIVQDLDTAGGTVDHAHFLKSDDTIYGKMTCGTSGTEFVFSSLEIEAEELLIISSCDIDWAPTVMT
jgi:hypothetical protein